MTDLNEKRVLVYATKVDGKKGATGATIGTSVVVRQLNERYVTEEISLNSYGIDSLGANGSVAKVRRAMIAARATISSWAKIAARGMKGPKVHFFYYLPSASLGGALRDAGLTILLGLFFRKAHIIQHVRNGNYFVVQTGLQARVRNFATNRVDRIFVLSERLLPEWVRNNSDLMSRIVVLPNTIDDALIPDQTQKTIAIRPEKPLKVLYFSNYIQEKGYMTLLDAASILCDRKLAGDIHLTFHGKFPSEHRRIDFLEKVSALQQRGLSIFPGDVVSSRPEAQRLYAEHDVFCLPTSYAAEAQPRSILEAMANGCAIISTRWRSVPDMVIDGETGFLIDERDPEMLADALEKCLNSDWSKLQAASQDRFQNRYSPQSVTKQLHEGFEL